MKKKKKTGGRAYLKSLFISGEDFFHAMEEGDGYLRGRIFKVRETEGGFFQRLRFEVLFGQGFLFRGKGRFMGFVLFDWTRDIYRLNVKLIFG